MPPDSRHAAQIIESINKKAGAVKDSAAALNERIRHFEQYLGSLPGRVDTIFYGWHPEEHEPWMSLAIRLHREGKDWVLSCGTYDERAVSREGADYDVGYKRITDAPLKWKMAAIKQFPNLLAQIEKSQDQLIEEMDKVAAEFDVFAATLTPPMPPATQTPNASADDILKRTENNLKRLDDLNRLSKTIGTVTRQHMKGGK